MRFSLTTIAAFALAASKAADAAVVYVTPSPVVEVVTEMEPPVELIATVSAPPVFKTVQETNWETQIIYQAKTVQVTAQATTIISTLSNVEPNKVSPANIQPRASSLSNSIPTNSFSIPRAIYPVLTDTSSSSSSSTPTSTTSELSVPSSTSLAIVTSPSPASTSTSTSSSTSSSTSTSTSTSTLTSTSTSSSSSSSSLLSSSSLSTTVSSTSSKSEAASSPTSSSSPSTSSSGPSSAPSAAIQSIIPGGYYSNQDIFQPIDTSAPPAVFARKPLNVPLPLSVQNSAPIQTNKFYSNIVIGDQTQPIYCLPYKLAYTNNKNNLGMAISYTDFAQRVFGPLQSDTNAAEYYINPVYLNSFIVGAKELTQTNTNLSVSNMGPFSADAAVTNGPGHINFPLVQGMGFVTAEYDGTLTPVIQSPIGIKTLSKRKTAVTGNVHEYRVILGSGASWSIFVTLPSASSTFDFTVDGTTNSIIGTNKDAVVIQIAFNPANTQSSQIYRTAAGAYQSGASLYGSVINDNTANHGITYSVKGSSASGNPLIFALPHHLQGFISSMGPKAVNLTMASTTKGIMSGYLTSSLDFTDTLPREIMFLPWSSAPAYGKGLSYSADALKLIASSANSDLNQDMTAQVMTGSTYYSGKAMDKFAYILLVVNDILQDKNTSRETLGRIQDLFSNFTQNRQQYPLMYDTLYKGVTSSASIITGDVNADFGSPVYSDHHFHYGYFVHAAALIGYIDQALGGNWAQQNKDWVNSLVRDVANPSEADTYFPVSRSFDWYAGHSWAKGLFASADGKDEESSSEDYNFAYGMKLWGRVIGDKSMESRGDLMLAVMKRSLSNYFLMETNNIVQPNNFIGNKIPGITFENKLDHTTYFGNNIEYIQGIHMLPVTPVSSYFRTADFVQQEWNQVLAPVVPTLNSGWLGILRSNQALFDPKTAYNFFSSPTFNQGYLDGGASLTWYLAFSAGVGGAQAS